jgi:hypothetical protein
MTILDARRGRLPVRFSALDGTVRWRSVPWQAFERLTVGSPGHRILCRLLEVDETRTRFDLASTVYDHGRGEGYVLQGGEPIGTLHVAREGERMPDHDPTDRRDRLRL